MMLLTSKSKNMDEHVICLQYKMNIIIRSQCELEINGKVYVFWNVLTALFLWYNMPGKGSVIT